MKWRRGVTTFKVGNGNANGMLQAPFSVRAHFCVSKGPCSCMWKWEYSLCNAQGPCRWSLLGQHNACLRWEPAEQQTTESSYPTQTLTNWDHGWNWGANKTKEREPSPAEVITPHLLWKKYWLAQDEAIEEANPYSVFCCCERCCNFIKCLEGRLADSKSKLPCQGRS